MLISRRMYSLRSTRGSWGGRVARRAGLGIWVGVVALAPRFAHAESIISQPGNHPKYTIEFEPHLLLGWANIDTNDPFPHKIDFGNNSGFGPGLRLSIPLVDNGFIKKINNNVALGFGVDWAHYGGPGSDVLWFPVVMQWNFFITDIITVFGEPGGAFRYVSSHGHSELHVDGVLQAGAKFMFSRSVGLTLRAGYPYFSAGLTLLL
jgi:hypothetical protein